MASNTMLSVPCKHAISSLDIKKPIATYISSNFSPETASAAASILSEAQVLRNRVVELSGSPDDLRNSIINYYRFLLALETKVPFGRERGGVGLVFSWNNAFQPAQHAEQASPAFERASIMFNLGAVSSQLAIGTDLTTDAGVKTSARSFQEAAGAFEYLKLRVIPSVSSPRPDDLSAESAGMLATLCLSQAQECFYVKAAADKKTPALLARISRQVAVFYAEVAAAQLPDGLRRSLGKSWAAHVKTKAALFDALTRQHQADVFIADDECGSQIACLEKAAKQLESARRESSGWVQVDKELQARVAQAQQQTQTALTKAYKENECLYFQRIPSVEDLPLPAPALLVAVVPPPPDLDTVEEKWFAYLNGKEPNRGRVESFGTRDDAPPDAFQRDDYVQQPGTPPPQEKQRSSGGSIGGTLGKFALKAGGWALNKAASAITESARAPPPPKGASRNIAAMYNGSAPVTIADLMNGGAYNPPMPQSEPVSNVAGGVSISLDNRKATDKYVERVRSLINTSMDRIGAAERERNDCLARWKLPECLDVVDPSTGSKGALEALSRGVRTQLQDERKAGGVQHLLELLRKIEGCRTEAIARLDTIEQQLGIEAREDEAARSHYGSEWSMPAAYVASGDLQDQVAAYRQNLADAAQSDKTLQALVADNQAAFAAVGLGTLPGEANTLLAQGSSTDLELFTATVRSSLGALDQLTQERNRLLDAFKRQWNGDRIVQASRKGAKTGFQNWELEQGMRKFNDLEYALSANTDRQTVVVRALDANMKEFGSALSKQGRNAQDQVDIMERTIKRFSNVDKSLNGGLNFYGDLLAALDTLQADTNAYLLARYEEGREAATQMAAAERAATVQKAASQSSSRWPFARGSRWQAVQDDSSRVHNALKASTRQLRRQTAPAITPRRAPRTTMLQGCAFGAVPLTGKSNRMVACAVGGATVCQLC